MVTDTLANVRAFIAANITDPVLGERTDNSTFIVSKRPRQNLEPAHIVVSLGGSDAVNHGRLYQFELIQVSIVGIETEDRDIELVAMMDTLRALFSADQSTFDTYKLWRAERHTSMGPTIFDQEGNLSLWSQTLLVRYHFQDVGS